MPNVEVKVIDSREITAQSGLTAEQVEQLGKAIVDAGQNGYKLVGVNALYSGHQRDQYVTGMRLRFSR